MTESNDKNRSRSILDRWKPIIDSFETPNKDWLNEYINKTINNTIVENTEVNEYSNILPICMKVSAQTIGLDLVSVIPMHGLTVDESIYSW